MPSGLPRSKVDQILHQIIFLFLYKLQSLQSIGEVDKGKRLEFTKQCLSHIDVHIE